MSTQRTLTRAGAPTSRPRLRGWRRRAIWSGVVLVVLAVVVFAGGAWYFSGQIRAKALQVDPLHDRPNVAVADVGPGWVELNPTRDMSEKLASDEVYGLDWDTGFGLIRNLRSSDGDQVRRDLEVLFGTPPTAGTAARLTRDAYPRDGAGVTEELLGFPLKEVSYRSPAGTFPAYLADGTSDTWAVLVHGRGATRSEMFRLMRVTAGLGMPSLDIAYRDDPETGGGLAHYGQKEWPDLQAAIEWTLDRGAHRVVLVATSMGAAIAADFLQHSQLAANVSGLVMDAPMLDFDALIRYGAEDVSLPVLGKGVPGPLVSAALAVASMRYGIDRDEVDYLDDTTWLKVPVLAFHGTEDPKVPVSTTRRLAAAEPDLVTSVVVPGAGHVESWNVDPAAYERQVREFLRSLT